MINGRALDIHPAFGYETTRRWEVAVDLRDEDIKRKGRDPAEAHHRLWGRERMIINNFSKAASYFPGVNVIVGLARIICCSMDLYQTTNPEKKFINAKHIGRGFAEIFFGPLLIIVDVIQTIRDRSLVKAYLEIQAAKPLFDAVEKGDLAALKKALLTKKLSVNSFNSEGMPLLIEAVRYQNQEIIKYLLDQPDLNINIYCVNPVSGAPQCTALHGAASQDNANILQLLLQKDIAPNILNQNGYTPLHYACAFGSLKVVKALIADPRVDINVKDGADGFGYTPFLFAIARRRLEIVTELINTKKEKLHFEDKDQCGNNIFHLLFSQDRLLIMSTKDGANLVKLVLESCPQANKKQLLSEKNQNGKTPYELGMEALKAYSEEGLNNKEQQKYDQMSALFQQLDPTKCLGNS
jgi:Ankyrin repeats (3 copies)